ncbi:GNAT family N-acetyltransferase [Agarivorans aestuarii]|uniref:GNAT family N-acetyltransferase n=1 Tax=Agarivorans aestuarii TaxID=1563703 RepID=A0ABU7GAS5_9ALTE|nr:GNAT family N-acetyltransferase [Agarivorans aestuarii]MEE1675565.1 GNAT family N-acetyltransferase [Agarivorans aestuarii]
MMVAMNLQPFAEHYFEQVLALQVAPEQQNYVKSIADILQQLSEQQSAHLMMVDKLLVGFFVIDQHYPYKQDLALNKAVLLRSFFVDQRHQGNGYGYQAGMLLKDYVSQLISDSDLLGLTVNCRNHAAQALYKKCGFIDSGVLYRGGPAGPQHIYLMKLRKGSKEIGSIT